MNNFLTRYCPYWLCLIWALLLLLSSPAFAAYPVISGDNSFEWITNVSFNTIDNTTAADGGGYGDYTVQSTSIAPGANYPLSVTIKPDTGEKISVFFDWNHNELFTDPGEEIQVTPEIIQSPDPATFTATVTVSVPPTAPLGTTRMRVVLSYLVTDTDPVQSAGVLPGGEAEDYTVVVDNGSGNPVITATATAGGIITPSGSVIVTSGADQSFTLTPDGGFFIDDVQVDGSSVGKVSTYTFTGVVANHTIHAVFSNTLNHIITATAGAGGSVTPAGAISVADGGSQSFSIQPISGYKVADVTVDGASVGAVSSYSFINVTAAHTLDASFIVDAAYPAVSSSDFSKEWITNVTFGNINNSSNAEGFASFLSLTPQTTVQQGGEYPIAVTIHAQADENISVFIDWNQDGDFLDTGETTSVITLTGLDGPHQATVMVPAGAAIGETRMRVVVRYFEPAIATGDLAANNSGGEAEDYAILIAPPVPAIDASAGAGGTITPNGLITVATGTDQSLTIDVNDPLFFIQQVLVDGVALPGPFTPLPYTYTFTNITVTHTIRAEFADVPVITITATAGADGTITPFGVIQVPVGDDKVFSILPNQGFKVQDVLVDGVSVGPLTSYTFASVAADHAISALFEKAFFWPMFLPAIVRPVPGV